LEGRIILDNHLSWELGIERSPYGVGSEAYSNKFDLRSVSRRCKDSAYRLIVAVKEEPREQGYIQYIPSPEDEGENQFFGRTVDRAEVSVSLLRSSIRRCDKYHENICEEDGVAGRRLPENLRLIDVRKRSLIRAPVHNQLPYVTPSYVWGAELMKREIGVSPTVTNRADFDVESSW